MMVRLTPLRLVCTALVLCVLVLASLLPRLAPGERGYEIFVDRPPPARHGVVPEVVFGDACSPFSAGAMEEVTVVLKIDVRQVATSLPRFVGRLGRCKLDLLIFSDRKDTYNGFDVHDALAHLRPEYKFNNPDFDFYDSIQPENGSTEAQELADGWPLDKYKFLPMTEWTSYLRPESRWYLFLEPDTYVNYDNLYRFLTHFNPTAAHYFGSPIWPRKKAVFAHAGSGFILSRAALDKLIALGRMFGENKHFPGTHFFGIEIKKQCCGDEALAQILKRSGVPLRGYWPMFNGEKVDTLRFSKEQWCEAIITMHQLDDDDFAALSRFEAARPHPARPLTFEELFTMVESRLQDRIDDWSNLSDDVLFKKSKAAAKTPDKCLKACIKDSDCMQWEHSGVECRLGFSVRLGHQHPSEGERQWTSGWMLDRIQAFKRAQSPCQGARFVHANP